MQNIEQVAIQTYQENIKYLQKEHIKLYKLLEEFEMAIQDTHYTPKYDLEYINGGFDLKEISSGRYLYNQDPLKEMQKQVEAIDFSKKTASIKTFQILDIDKVEGNEYQRRAKRDIYELMHYTLKYHNESHEMKQIQKFIFFGVGLGIHIEPIHQKIKAKNYLIVEDHIEKFKLSLFTTKYYEIAKTATIYFSIYEHLEQFLAISTEFLQNGYIYNYLIKYTHLESHSPEKLKHFLSLLSVSSFSLFPYQLVLDKMVSPLKAIQEGYRLTNIYKQVDPNIFKSKPVIVLAAGPSLAKNIEWLSNNSEKFIVIAVSTILKLLDQHNIKPDIVVSLDAEELVHDYFVGYKNKDFLSHSVVLFSSMTHKKVLQTQNSNSFVFDVSLRFHSEGANYMSPCVGSFAYLYSLSLPTSKIYLLGLDLALDQETGEDHFGGYNREIKKVQLAETQTLSPSVNSKETAIKVVGNFQDTVFTTPLFETSLSAITRYAPILKKDGQEIYNLSQGAKIEKAQPLKIEELTTKQFGLFDKEEFFLSFLQQMQKNRLVKLSSSDIEVVQNYKKMVLKITKLIQKYEKKTKSKNPQKYLQEISHFAKEVMAQSMGDRSDMLDVNKRYFEYALNIAYDFFNDKDLKDIHSHINNIDTIILKGIKNIMEQVQNVVEKDLGTLNA